MGFEKIKVYAFVGPSGTGKSYRAQMVASENDINFIIDDGLLIKDNEIVAGLSAKKAPTKIETVKHALFLSKDEQNQIVKALQKYKPEKILILGTILVFSCIVIVVGIFISEAIVKPLNKMIINAQKLANGESVELIELNPKKKRKKKTELDSIINIISVMNVEMNQKLNEVNRQKREIEAILLHMNDGIVAFDEKGNFIN